MPKILDKVTDFEDAFALLYPAAKKHGKYLRVGSIEGEAGDSAVIYIDSGYLYDFQGGESYDLVDCIRRVKKVDFKGATDWLKFQGLFKEDDNRSAVKSFSKKIEKMKVEMQLAPSDAKPPKAITIAKDCAKVEKISLTDIVPPSEGGIQLYPYRNADGKIALLQARINMKDGSKKFLRYVWKRYEHTPSKGSWKLGGTAGATKLPVYNLVEALERPDDPVMIVEGEKTCEAAKVLFPDYACISILDTETSDLDWLKNRSVLILPDYDRQGSVKATSLVDLLECEAPLDPDWVAKSMGQDAGEYGSGWDVGDIPITDRPDCTRMFSEAMAKEPTNEEYLELVVELLGDKVQAEAQDGWYSTSSFCHNSETEGVIIFGAALEGSENKLFAVCDAECDPDSVYRALLGALDTANLDAL